MDGSPNFFQEPNTFSVPLPLGNSAEENLVLSFSEDALSNEREIGPQDVSVEIITNNEIPISFDNEIPFIQPGPETETGSNLRDLFIPDQDNESDVVTSFADNNLDGLQIPFLLDGVRANEIQISDIEIAGKEYLEVKAVGEDAQTYRVLALLEKNDSLIAAQQIQPPDAVQQVVPNQIETLVPGQPTTVPGFELVPGPSIPSNQFVEVPIPLVPGAPGAPGVAGAP
ncbi:MAG: hypothetical protein F6K17_12055, partial [Okeania sp. SIO3C4]|nr:hypothetical protein [Okeania sp. SIO3C4]